MSATEIIGIVSLLGFIILMAPNVLHMNAARGTTLRNIAIWLFIFVTLVALYQYGTTPRTPAS